MIIYFSGTGNSKHVAERLAEFLDEELFNIECCQPLPSMTNDEPLGIIFPVYAWGLPRIVEDYLQIVKITNRFVWTVMTCGDDMGYADVILEKLIKRRINAAYSLQMPNTYVCLPGFDVDSPELASRKIAETEAQLPQIAESIRNREQRSELTRGGMAWMKTYVLRPLFNKLLVTDRFFRKTPKCTSCGLCAKQCPTKSIAMTTGEPVWQHQMGADGSQNDGSSCTGCLRCYHNCPKRAIEWGRFTKNKGQKTSIMRATITLGLIISS